MATPSLPKPISITFSAALGVGTVVKIFNRTTGESIDSDPVQKGSTTHLVYDLANLSEGWTEGDIIELRVTSSNSGQATVTLTADTAVPQEVSMTTADAPTDAGWDI